MPRADSTPGLGGASYSLAGLHAASDFGKSRNGERGGRCILRKFLAEGPGTGESQKEVSGDCKSVGVH